jgi:hypothetical protein
MNTTQTAHTPDPGRTPPVQEIRLGAIRAAIWKNETENGVRHNVTFERIYKDGDTWRSTSSFGRDDLLLLGKVADQAHSWIHGQGRDSGAAAHNGGTQAASDPGPSSPPTGNRPRRRPDGPLSRSTLPSAPAEAR